MSKRTNKNRRPRPSVEKQKRALSKDSNNTWYSFGEDVQLLKLEKAGTHAINIVPYEVRSNNHPDDVPAGSLWYRFPFKVHFNVGPNKKSIVCPTTVGKPCPICEEVSRLNAEDFEGNKEITKNIRAKDWMAYPVLLDTGEFGVFIFSSYKFADVLEKELSSRNQEKYYGFWDVENGYELQVRFDLEKFAGKDFLRASRIDFESREDMDEDDVLDNTVCLDEAFVIMSYDEVNKLFTGAAEDDADEDEDHDREKRRPVRERKSKKRTKPTRTKAEPAPEPEPADDENVDDDEAWEEEWDDSDDDDDVDPDDVDDPDDDDDDEDDWYDA